MSRASRSRPEMVRWLRRVMGLRRQSLISPEVSRLSGETIAQASKIQSLSIEKCGGSANGGNQLAREVFRLTHEQAVVYHRATLCLAENGWAHTVQPTVKAMVEGYINCAVIAERDSELRAFKHLVFEPLKTKMEEITRQQVLAKIRQSILPVLSEIDRSKGEAYITQPKLGYYPYSSEYKGPRDVLNRLLNGDFLSFYDVGGSASHGGELGYKFFDHGVERQDINPRSHPFTANTVIVQSLQVLLQFNGLRIRFENMPGIAEVERLLKRLSSLRPQIEALENQ